MAPAPIELSDVAGVIPRPLEPDEERAIPAWIQSAWTRLHEAVPGLDARMLLPETRPDHIKLDTVCDVLIAMVERKVHNPTGRRQWQTDSYGETVDQALSSGEIYVSDAELARFEIPAPGNGGMFVVTMGTPC